MANVAAVMETQKCLESMLLKKMNEMESQLKSVSPKQDMDRISQIEGEFRSFKDLVYTTFSLLRQQISEILRSLDETEMRHRQKSLLLSGVAERSDEDLFATTISLFQRHLGLSDINDIIKRCYRLSRYSEGHVRPIVVQFSNQTCRSTVWKNKTKLKGSSMVLHEFLTKNRQVIFKSARDHFGMTKVWTLNGSIYILTPDGNRVRLTSSDELDKIKKQFPKPPTSTSTTTQASNLKLVQSRSRRVNKKT
ncbi:unnamed protein product [Diatraea saccharalis]|uniref:Uncharacterized protein n=1 Tax=Diatraea saccharalis TaxID=40085 RepID=A0A9N9R3E2_9NEOP|nr:unnamed protein product [Diatraea saccharalis]